jgi:hypothetical protein
VSGSYRESVTAGLTPVAAPGANAVDVLARPEGRDGNNSEETSRRVGQAANVKKKQRIKKMIMFKTYSNKKRNRNGHLGRAEAVARHDFALVGDP